MKKILVALVVVCLAGVYSCSKNDPGIQPPSTFGEATTPSATITLGKNAFAVGETITFSATAVNTGSYSWDFGDGSSPSTDAGPTHSYLGAGVYKVTLTVYSADKAHKYTVVTYVVIGTRYWDSTALIQVPPADSAGNAWEKSLGFPIVAFDFQKTNGGTPEITSLHFWTFDPSKYWDLRYSDSTTAHVLTPESWTYELILSQDGTANTLSTMHSWTIDMTKETANPIMLRGSRPESPYQVKVYWHVQ